MKKRYKGIRDKQRKSGEGRESDQDLVPADFPFYDAIDAVEGKRASVTPVHLMDSASTGDTQLQHQEGDEDEIKVLGFSSRPDTPASASRPGTPASGRIELDNTSTPVASFPEIPDSPIRTATDQPGPSSRPDATSLPCTAAGKEAYEPKKKRRRKMTKLEKAEESADTLVTKILTDQAKRRAESAQMEKR